ncbi:DUF4468 domain-containing protein [Larkinella soli]|uniref:DUF4468 domain-containing protein n=1 Tax=Larkinella soli TaxID=1770527 RepID=UPI000FFB5B06|nr:DUF4468 domain-containing protein [Larkinella soli]
MRTSVVLVLMLWSLAAVGQKRYMKPEELNMPLNPETGLWTYTEVVEVPGVSATDLYNKAKAFFFNQFNNADAVIQVDDPGKLLAAKGIVSISFGPSTGFQGSGRYWIPIEIQFKDGRYRYEVKNIAISIPGNPLDRTSIEQMRTMYMEKVKLSEKQIEQAKQGIVVMDEGFKGFLATFKKAMQAPKKDDW